MRVHLNRASSVYICIFTVFAAGVWLILQFGTLYLLAPRDLAGDWRILPAQAVPFVQSFSLHQSGKFVHLIFEGGNTVDLVLTHAQTAGVAMDGGSVTLSGHGWQIVASGPSSANTLKFSFRPPSSVAMPREGMYRRERTGQFAAPVADSAPPPSGSSTAHARE